MCVYAFAHVQMSYYERVIMGVFFITSVCMCAYMRVIECVHVDVFVRTCVCVYASVHVHMGVHMHFLYMSGLECGFVYIGCVYAHAFVHMCV